MEDHRGSFFVKAQYNKKESLLVDIECHPPLQFMAKVFIEDSKVPEGIILDPNSISFPSIENLKGFSNLKENIFFLIHQAILTTKTHGFSNKRLQTGVSVVGGKIKNIFNCAVSENTETLMDISLENVQQKGADWAASFSFVKSNDDKEGMSIDLVTPSMGYTFFIPIIYNIFDGDLYFKICVQETELIAYGSSGSKKINSQQAPSLAEKEQPSDSTDKDIEYEDEDVIYTIQQVPFGYKSGPTWHGYIGPGALVMFVLLAFLFGQ
jgi:hypothetical protein